MPWSHAFFDALVKLRSCRTRIDAGNQDVAVACLIASRNRLPCKAVGNIDSLHRNDTLVFTHVRQQEFLPPDILLADGIEIVGGNEQPMYVAECANRNVQTRQAFKNMPTIAADTGNGNMHAAVYQLAMNEMLFSHFLLTPGNRHFAAFALSIDLTRCFSQMIAKGNEQSIETQPCGHFWHGHIDLSNHKRE